MNERHETEIFTFTVGVEPGYSQDGEGTPQRAMYRASYAWQAVAEAAYQETGVYVAAVVHPALAVYRYAWGCPAGGEAVATLIGGRNPRHSPDARAWREQVERVAEAVRVQLGQETAYLFFHPVDFVYLRKDGVR